MRRNFWTYTDHAFEPGEGRRCRLCQMFPGEAIHILALPGIADAEDLAIAKGQSTTELLNRPLMDISAKAGRMERDSPLFFGTGDNPLLF